MNIIFLLIIVSLIIAVGFLSAFIWAVKSGQYEDDYTPSVRMLFEDKPVNRSAAQPLGGAAGNTPAGQSSSDSNEK